MKSFVSAADKERIIADVQAKGVQFVDYEFVDILGQPKMCETTVSRLEELLTDGLWFDGSSIEGFVRIYESDMFLIPDASTYAVLPWSNGKVARIICDVHKSDGTPFEGDPRLALKKMKAKAAESGFDLKVGPELEFFIFKSGNGGGIDPATAQVHDDASYFDLATKDAAVDLRRQIVPALEAMGLRIEMSHHEVAPGQHEIDFRYGDSLAVADSVLTYKTTVRTLAKQYGLFASFMPKPVFGINGSDARAPVALERGEKHVL
jgi:glutamine synthetase